MRREGPDSADEKKRRMGRSSFAKAARRSFFSPALRPQTRDPHYSDPPMGAWYTIGLLAGLGAAFGVLAAALVPRLAVAVVAACAAGVVVGVLVFGWAEAVAGGIGGVLGALGAVPVVS